jgi:hypothetical protein
VKGFCEFGNEYRGPIKSGELLTSYDLLTSQEGFSCMELESREY